jgi:hypothetical protein
MGTFIGILLRLLVESVLLRLVNRLITWLSRGRL